VFQKTILKNGLRLITAQIEGTQAITALVLFKVGSRYETKTENGVSHFIEHMMFKGTKRRPNTLALSKDLDRVGAEYNAFTSRDYTGYFVKVDAKKLDLAFDILSDMLLSSKFEGAEIEKEKGVISEEIRMYEDNPMMFIEDLFEETLFGGDHPLGRSVAGSVKGINSFSREMMVGYKEKYYTPNNAVLVLAGNLKGKKINNLAEKYFGKKGESAKPSFRKFAYPKKDNKFRIKIQHKKTEQVQLALGFPAYSYFDPKIYALNLLGVILGGNMSSRLFISIREKMGLCYFIKSYANIYEDTGNMIIQAGLDKTRIVPAVKAILDELNKVKKAGAKKEELERAKECIKGRLILTLEDSSNVADWYAKQELLMKEILTPEEKLKRIFSVSGDDIKKVANDIFLRDKLNLAMIGPVGEEEFKKQAKLNSFL
jgi:predicted Zn-dependent peptidase